MKRILILLALAGCAGKPPVRVDTQIIKEPVAVACIDRAKVPAEPAPIGALPLDARQASDILGAKLTDTRTTIRLLMALIGPCTKG